MEGTPSSVHVTTGTQDAGVSIPDNYERPLALDRHSQPPPAKRHLASLHEDSSGDRSSGDSDVEITSELHPSLKTEKNTKWALCNFGEWQRKRNARFPGDTEQQVPSDLLVSSDPMVLNKWLSLYAAETRKLDSREFPPKTIYHLLAGVLRHMRSLNPACPNILHTSNPLFKPLHDTLQNIFLQYQANNPVSEPKSTEPFSEEEEDRLWTSGALSTDTPIGLLRAVYFLNGKNFGLVGGRKLRQLKISQLKRVIDPPRYVYTEAAVDTPTGEAESLNKVWHKKNRPTQVVFIDADVEKGNRCHVHVLDLYLQKLPPEAFQNDIFYLQPIKHSKSPSVLIHWFNVQPLGKNSLGRMMRDICSDAGIDGLRTLKYIHVDRASRPQQHVQQLVTAQSVIPAFPKLPRSMNNLPPSQPPTQIALNPTQQEIQPRLPQVSHIQHLNVAQDQSTELSSQQMPQTWQLTNSSVQDQNFTLQELSLPPLSQLITAGSQSTTNRLLIPKKQQSMTTGCQSATVSTDQQSPNVGSTNQQSDTAGSSNHLSATAGSSNHLSATAGPSNHQLATEGSTNGSAKGSTNQRSATIGSANQQSTTAGSIHQPATALQSPISLTEQGCDPLQAIPIQFSITNCHVHIYVSPPQPPPNT